VGGGIQLRPLGTAATDWPAVPAPGDYDYGEFCGIEIGRGNRSTRRELAPAPLYPPQIPLDQTRDRTRGGKPATNRLGYGDDDRIKNTRVCMGAGKPLLAYEDCVTSRSEW
jgi:hypothetical protein